MAFYTSYLVCYDVEDNRVRRKLAEFLKDLGLQPLQKSVFWGALNAPEVRSLERYVHKHLDPDTDRCFWIHTRLDEQQLKQGVGYQAFKSIPPDGFVIV